MDVLLGAASYLLVKFGTVGGVFTTRVRICTAQRGYRCDTSIDESKYLPF